MQRSKWRPSPGTVLGLLALAVAAAGTAIADPLAMKSVLNKKEKKQVTRIAQGQVNQLAPGLSVARAGTADRAGSAGNADTLEGQKASDFTSAGEVHNSGRVASNDPVSGDALAEQPVLLVAGPFTVRGLCAQNLLGSGNDIANVRMEGPAGSSYAGAGTGSAIVEVPDASTSFLLLNETGTGNAIEAAHITAAAPSGGVVSVSVSAEKNDGGADCVFAATAIGP